jgi:cytochrome c-type biogenesis protein CcmH
MQLLRAVLQLNPNHQGALMLLGLGAFNSGDYEQALHVWRQLLALQDPDSQGAELLRNGINRAEQRLASRGENKTSSAESSPVTSPQVMVTVDLAPALREKLSPQDTLFIFAKATDGSPMPLAAVQQPVQSFPVQVILDDERAVMPAMKLSDFQQIVVIARISKAGNVTAQPGDLQGAPATVNVHKGRQSVSLLIDQVVQ